MGAGLPITISRLLSIVWRRGGVPGTFRSRRTHRTVESCRLVLGLRVTGLSHLPMVAGCVNEALRACELNTSCVLSHLSDSTNGTDVGISEQMQLSTYHPTRPTARPETGLRPSRGNDMTAERIQVVCFRVLNDEMKV